MTSEGGVMKKPNIIFILSDDHGSWATGAYGNCDVLTPNIDRLAAEGVLFENFFCASPVCSPARASILTGQMPSYHGVHDWLNGGNLNLSDYQETTVSEQLYLKMINAHQINELELNADNLRIYNHPQYKGGVRREMEELDYVCDCQNYVKDLHSNGYRCGLVGKWHLGATMKQREEFEFWAPVSKGGTNYMFPEIAENGKIKIKDQYVSEYIGDQALSFLEHQTDEQPFYLSVHFTAPHSPWGKADHPSHIWEKYKGRRLVKDELELHPQASYTAPRPSKEVTNDELLTGYYTAITAMDEQIGRILDYANSNGLSENTIVIYTSDNGMNLGQHGVWGKGNGTFPLNFYEESIKVPFIIKTPNQKPRNSSQVKMMSHYDLYPTILDFAAIPVDRTVNFPGRSFKPLLDGENMDNQDVVIFDEYGPNRMIRTERYKLIIRYDQHPSELYDLKLDPNEKDNLLLKMSYDKLGGELNERLELWFAKFSNQINDGRKTKVTGFGQYHQLQSIAQPFERIDEYY